MGHPNSNANKRRREALMRLSMKRAGDSIRIPLSLGKFTLADEDHRPRYRTAFNWNPAPPQEVQPITVLIEPVNVPLPTDRVRVATVSASTREGQAEFRTMVLAAYGQCCLTGCVDEVALHAAHIVPYANRASNVIRNALCLRSDLHALYDAHLIEIGEDGVAKVADSLKSPEYRALHGKQISSPRSPADSPDPRLLAEHKNW